jgi:hypothetical protein
MKQKVLPILLLVVGCLAYGQDVLSSQVAPQPAPTLDVATASPTPLNRDARLYVKVKLDNGLKISALKPGDSVEGMLAQGVYSGDRELFPAGSRIRLTVDRLERRRREANDRWPWVVRVFTPRHENYPWFRSASVFLPGGHEVPLQVSLIAIARKMGVQATAKNGETAPASSSAAPPQAQSGKKEAALIATFEAVDQTATPWRAESGETTSTVQWSPVTLLSGTQAKIILLGGVSASKSLAGDSFQARLIQPVRLGSRVVLPEGTVLEGKVVKSTRPRWLSRSGSLLLTFTGLALPGGGGNPIVASVSGAELDRGSTTRIDAEGRLKGSPGKAWMLINAGVTAGIAKVADDGAQLVIEAIVATATDASTAGTGRAIALCASGLFMVTRHGRDVVLPRFTEMDITFDRPLSLAAPQATPGME